MKYILNFNVSKCNRNTVLIKSRKQRQLPLKKKSLKSIKVKVQRVVASEYEMYLSKQNTKFPRFDNKKRKII